MQKSVDEFLAKEHIPKECILMFMTDADHTSSTDHVLPPIYLRKSGSPKSHDSTCQSRPDADVVEHTALENLHQDNILDIPLAHTPGFTDCLQDSSFWSMHAPPSDFHEPLYINRIHDGLPPAEQKGDTPHLQGTPNTFSADFSPAEASSEHDTVSNCTDETIKRLPSGSAGLADDDGQRLADIILCGGAVNSTTTSANPPESAPHTNGTHPAPMGAEVADVAVVGTATGAAETPAAAEKPLATAGRRRRREPAPAPPPAARQPPPPPTAPGASAAPAAEPPDEATDPGAAREWRRREQNREAQRRFRERTRYREFHAFSRRLAAAGPGVVAGAPLLHPAMAVPLMPPPAAWRPAWKFDPPPPPAVGPWVPPGTPAQDFPPPALWAASGPLSFALGPGPYWRP
jgi:hypothetical protein